MVREYDMNDAAEMEHTGAAEAVDNDNGSSNVEMELTSASTTIDPTVVQSRIFGIL